MKPFLMTPVVDYLVTLTVTIILKIVNLAFVAAGGILVSQTHVYFFNYCLVLLRNNIIVLYYLTILIVSLNDSGNIYHDNCVRILSPKTYRLNLEESVKY